MNRKKTFTFKNREYTIEFPTIGQYFDIETDKVSISNGKWGELISSRTVSAYRAIQSMECICILKNLCPQLFEDMKVNNYKNIDAQDFTELILVYTKDIQPWYSDWFEEFNKILSESSKEIKKQKEESNKEEEKDEEV